MLRHRRKDERGGFPSRSETRSSACGVAETAQKTRTAAGEDSRNRSREAGRGGGGVGGRGGGPLGAPPPFRQETRPGGTEDRGGNEEDHRGRYHSGSATTIKQGGPMNRAGVTVTTLITALFLLSASFPAAAEETRGPTGLPSYVKSPSDRPPPAGVHPGSAAPAPPPNDRL